MEQLLKDVEELNNNTPDGVIADADTILADILQSNDFEITGSAQEIFEIWKSSTDRESIENLFYALTGEKFRDYLEKCKNEITR